LNQRLPQRRQRRAVATFHDLFVLTGEYSTPEFRTRFARQAREAANRADLIVAVSAFTASQVQTYLGVEPSRIRVVHHGVRLPPGTAAVARERIVLSVGALQRRKNTVRLVEAFERVPEPWRLVLVGTVGYGGEEILARVEQSPRRKSIEVAGYVDNATLELLYARASIFTFPSLDEGFGMPVLEAMARGVPVVASNRSAIPEVCGDAAWLVNPEATEEIAHAMFQLACDEGSRSRMALRGLAHAQRFRWENAVEKTWEIYQELLS
jgi:glycosyltransferase involved in cell wall biosynthesis